MSDVSDAERAILARLATEKVVGLASIVPDFVSFEYIANHLETARRKICPYPRSETCDCKYGLGYGVNVKTSEKTGCPELREIIMIYRAAARGFPK